MKFLTAEELAKAPDIIQFIYINSAAEHPVGYSVYEEAINAYPEYFPEEVEYRKKWESVPREVKDAFEEEFDQRDQELRKKYLKTENKGLLYWISNSEHHKLYREEYALYYPERVKLEEQLYRKYYTRFGIKR